MIMIMIILNYMFFMNKIADKKAERFIHGNKPFIG
jgi:hypothetical protein